MVNTSITAALVTRLRSFHQVSKGNKAAGVITDNHNYLYLSLE
ncbi:hypothetical protein C8N25_103196 [Algoriphagus antarcticus]|uniref:Uncharacterized protein n=1 Tax=Algoriphagus antarcticus TaxID=238540 RepID=A0A3E0E1K5_9BACT|nr:hypothetical protein C8N25_103196 [Algoriphagus antarcticus]